MREQITSRSRRADRGGAIRRSRFGLLGLGLGVFALAGVAGCGGDDTTTDDLGTIVGDGSVDTEELEGLAGDALELGARNAAARLAPPHFADAGHPVTGGLSCSADAASDLMSVDVMCVGVTEDGGQAEMSGTMSEIPQELEAVGQIGGRFTGAVDGMQVFQTERLGS